MTPEEQSRLDLARYEYQRQQTIKVVQRISNREAREDVMAALGLDHPVTSVRGPVNSTTRNVPGVR